MTLVQLQGWLVRRERSHIAKCGWSVVIDQANPDLNDPIWDGLRRIGQPLPANPGAITSSEVAAVTSSKLGGLLLASRFYLLERVLSHYRSQATQGILNNRIEFSKRAEGLADDLYGKDRKGGLKAEMEEEINLSGGGALVGERLTYTNIPDAHYIQRHY